MKGQARTAKLFRWIPAFAGMTGCAGTTERAGTEAGQARAAVLFHRARCAVALAGALALICLAACDTDATATLVDPTLLPTVETTTSQTSAAVSAVSETAGVTVDGILFGQSAAFSGPAQELGINMRLGIEAAFAEANRSGGVHRRQLSLVSLDDTYEPGLAATNTKKLIDDERVFALIGEVGTPTSRSATPLAADSGVPFVAPFTGAAFLRNVDTWDNIINLRASYNDETEEMVKRFTEDLGLERIGVLYQDDSFGRAGYNGALAALARRGMEPVSVGVYPRNTKAVKSALIDLSRGRPEGIIMVGAYDPIGEFILWANETKLVDDAKFIAISFVGSNALAEKLGPEGEGVYVTQVVPFPTDTTLPIVSSYIKALSAFNADATPGFVSFEGYLAGRLAILGVESCGNNLTRSCFIDSLINVRNLDIGGFPVSYSEYDNQGSDTVFLTVIGSDGQYHPIQRLDEAVN